MTDLSFNGSNVRLESETSFFFLTHLFFGITKP
jgi:hypothetical protein